MTVLMQLSHKAESSMFDQLKPFLEGLVHVIGTFKLSFHVNLKKSRLHLTTVN